MGFKKADPQQAALKVAIYGPQGSGKTFTTLLFAEGIARREGKRVAYVDTERGTDFYAKTVKERKAHPSAFDFDAIYTRSLAEITSAVQSLKRTAHCAIAIDSMSHIWDAAMDAYTGRRTRLDGIPMHAWGRIKKPYRALVSWLIGSPFHVFIVGRQKNLFDTDGGEDMKKIGVAMRAEGETAYEAHVCLRMDVQPDGDSWTHRAYVEKDRSGLLQDRVFSMPTFKDLAPLLDLLGTTQGATDDERRRIADDGELQDRLSDDPMPLLMAKLAKFAVDQRLPEDAREFIAGKIAEGLDEQSARKIIEHAEAKLG